MIVEKLTLYKVLIVVLLFGGIVSCSPDDVNPESDDKEVIDSGEDEEDITPPNNNDVEVISPTTSGVVEIADDAPDFVWQYWYLSVPLNRGDGSATSIFYNDIVNYTLTANEKEYFYKNTDGSYTMYTKFTGFTTSGEKSLDGGGYCRTELREFWKGDQSTDSNWYMSAGTTHILESTLKVESCESSKGTYVAQIHGKESPTFGVSSAPATVKVCWDDNDLVIEYYIVPPNSSTAWSSTYIEKPVIATVNNSKFTIKLKVDDGKLYYGLVCEDEGINIDYTFLYDYLSNGYDWSNYFKTGNYFKLNTDYTSSAQVRLYSVKTAHSLP